MAIVAIEPCFCADVLKFAGAFFLHFFHFDRWKSQVHKNIQRFPFIYEKGEYTHEIETGKLTVPRRVHANGTHLTYNVTQFHDFEHDNQIDNDNTDDHYHYHIDLHDETVHVELR